MDRSMSSEAIRRLVLILSTIALLVTGTGLLTACDDDDATAAPAAIVSPIDHKTYCPWVETPHEADFGCDNPRVMYPPAPFPIPTDRPVQEPGMSAGDLALMLLLFNHGMGYHSYYFGPSYYDMYIGPAYTRWPGQTYYGWGHRPLTHVDARTYNTTIIKNVNTKYSADEKKFEKTATYKTANGKSFTGDKAPKSAFKGTNVPASTQRVGDAPVTGKQKATTPATKSTGTVNTGKSTGKSSYGGTSTGKYGGSTTSRSTGGSSSRSGR